jgi:hypothetical protein
MDGPPPQEEDFSSIPIADRLTHKNWKARVNAYEALIKIFQRTVSDSDPAFRAYLNNSDLLKRIATDSNAVAQEKGVECLVAFVKYAGETAAKTREAVVPALVDKCFGSSRAGTKTQAVELTLQYVEVGNGGLGVVVREHVFAVTTCLITIPPPDRHPSWFGSQTAKNCGRMYRGSQRNHSVSCDHFLCPMLVATHSISNRLELSLHLTRYLIFLGIKPLISSRGLFVLPLLAHVISGCWFPGMALFNFNLDGRGVSL